MKRVLISAIIVLIILGGAPSPRAAGAPSDALASPARVVQGATPTPQRLYVPFAAGGPSSPVPTATATASITPTVTATPEPTWTPTPPAPMPIITGTKELLNPALAYNGELEEFLLVWESAPITLPGGNGSVYAQRLSSAGAPIGSPATLARGNRVAAHPDVVYSERARQYVVVWVKTANEGRGEVHRHILSALGQSLSDSTLIVPNVGFWSQSAIAWDSSDGGYYLAWVDAETMSRSDVYGWRLDAQANPTGVWTDLCRSARTEKEVDVAYHEELQQFLVAWTDIGQSRVRYVTIDHGGVASAVYDVDPFDASQGAPSLARASLGRAWLMLWEDKRLSGDWNVWAMLAPGQAPTALDRYVAAQRQPSAASDTGRQYLAVWQDKRVPPDGASKSHDIYGLCLDHMGQPSGDAWPVYADNGGANGDQSNPAIAFDSKSGRYLVVWQDNGISGYGLYGIPVNACVSPPPKLEVSSSYTCTTRTGDCFPACRGDHIVYQVRVANVGGRLATQVVLTETVDASIILLPESVRSSPGGTAKVHDSQIILGPERMKPGMAMTLTFEVVVPDSTPYEKDTIANQERATCRESPPVDHATDISLGRPVLSATKDDSAPRTRSHYPGDVLEYRIAITNTGGCPAADVVFTDDLDTNTVLVPNSVSTCLGNPPVSGPNLSVPLGTIESGDACTVTFKAQIKELLGNVNLLSNRGQVTARGLPPQLTDDPETPDSDATDTRVCVPISATMQYALIPGPVSREDDFVPSVKDSLQYNVTLRNESTCPATGVVFTDRHADHRGVTLEPGSVVSSLGRATIRRGLGSADTEVEVVIGTLSPGQVVSISFLARIDDAPPPGPITVSNQGFITSNELPVQRTDDPDTSLRFDPTATPVVMLWDDGQAEARLFDPPRQGQLAAVLFHAPTRLRLTRLLYMLSHGPQEVRLRILDSNENDVCSPLPVTPPILPNGGWAVFDVTSPAGQSIFVEGDFYVALEWTNDSPRGPYLGCDTTKPHMQHSYKGHLSLQPVTDGDVMIRVLAEP